jgi:uncharacterized protein
LYPRGVRCLSGGLARIAISGLKKNSADRAVAIFARAPIPGRAKTRLGPVLGARDAAAVQSAFIADTIRKAASLSFAIERYLFLDRRENSIPVPPTWHRAYQNGRTLGSRLSRAFRGLFARYERVLIIGTDSPELKPQHLRQALNGLKTSDAVLGPCPDGGFYLIGLRHSRRAKLKSLFSRVRWGTFHAFQDMKRNLTESDLVTAVLEAVPDIDRPADLKRLVQRLKHNLNARRLAPATWRFIRSLKFPLTTN